MVAVRKDVHGPVAVVPTCFNKLIAGAGAFTRTLAVLVLPVPPLVEPTVTELFFRPVVLPVTLTENVHVWPAVKVALAKLIVVVPAVAIMVPPPQVPDKPFGVDTTKPA